MNNPKRILFFDMDGVLVDFQSGINALRLSPEEFRERGRTHTFDEVPGIFSLMKPTKGAIIAARARQALRHPHPHHSALG